MISPMQLLHNKLLSDHLRLFYIFSFHVSKPVNPPAEDRKPNQSHLLYSLLYSAVMHRQRSRFFYKRVNLLQPQTLLCVIDQHTTASEHPKCELNHLFGSYFIDQFIPNWDFLFYISWDKYISEYKISCRILSSNRTRCTPAFIVNSSTVVHFYSHNGIISPPAMR